MNGVVALCKAVRGQAAPYRHQSRRFYLPSKELVRGSNGKVEYLHNAMVGDHILRHILELKDMLAQEPDASLPLRVIRSKTERVRRMPQWKFFIHKYPHVFLPYISQDNIPLIKLTKAALELHHEETIIYRRCEMNNVRRLCKLLMMTKDRKLHLDIIDGLRYDLGLPHDYVQSLLPKYPEYLHIVLMDDDRPGLGLVFWNRDLAYSALELRALKRGRYKRGGRLIFPMRFPEEIKVKMTESNWLRVKKWQRIPYSSPYEDFSPHSQSRGGFKRKRLVAVCHELLSLTVQKRAAYTFLVPLHEPLGLHRNYVKCFRKHPGVFYKCGKGGHTYALLKEAYGVQGMRGSGKHTLARWRDKFMDFILGWREELWQRKRKWRKQLSDRDSLDWHKREYNELEDSSEEEEESCEEEDNDDDDEDDEEERELLRQISHSSSEYKKQIEDSCNCSCDEQGDGKEDMKRELVSESLSSSNNTKKSEECYNSGYNENRKEHDNASHEYSREYSGRNHSHWNSEILSSKQGEMGNEYSDDNEEDGDAPQMRFDFSSKYQWGNGQPYKKSFLDKIDEGYKHKQEDCYKDSLPRLEYLESDSATRSE